MAEVHAEPPVRGTQLLVEHIGTVLRRPQLIGIELAWRWLFGIPFLIVCAQQVQQILARFPLDASGFNAIDMQNPWTGATQLSQIIAFYQPPVAAAVHALLPLAALAWILLSGFGRAVLLWRLGTDRAAPMPFRPVTVIVLQIVWGLGLGLAFYAWFASMQWAWVSHVPTTGDPDLIGYSIWAIFLTLACFTVWALVSWTVSVAPLLALLERRSILGALAASFKLGRAFSGKLAEINLVLGIVKLALLVVAMVFSAAPLPFSDELGPQAMHAVWIGSMIFFLIADDIFQVVRLKAFVEFWKTYRGPHARSAE